jgi:hypothetical protein
MAHFVQVIDARLMNIIEQGHGHHFVRIGFFTMRHIIPNDRAPKAMFRDALRILDAGDPPSTAFDLFQKAGFRKKIDGTLMSRPNFFGDFFSVL